VNHGETLAKLRKENGYTQDAVAEYINKYSNKSYIRQTVSHWEKGVAMPTVEQFLLLCELYSVKDIQKIFRGIDTDFRNITRLNILGKNKVEDYISVLLGNPLYSESESAIMEYIPRRMKLYDAPVAAGSGYFLDSDTFEIIEIDDTVPKNADFAVRVSGDSMEPRFIDGQIIFIKEQQTLNVGDIGIFSINGDAYVKKYGTGVFISVNPQYAPIPINEFDSVHVFGKVIG